MGLVLFLLLLAGLLGSMPLYSVSQKMWFLTFGTLWSLLLLLGVLVMVDLVPWGWKWEKFNSSFTWVK